MLALNTSWPLPPNSSDRPLVNSATTQAPSTPATTPPAIHACAGDTGRYRHDDADDQAGLEHLAKHDQERGKHGTLTPLSFHAACHFIALFMAPPDSPACHDENRRRNCSGPAAAAAHNRCAAADRNDFLEMQIGAFEFRDDRIEVLDRDVDRLAGRRMQLGRIEFLILDRDRKHDRIVCARGGGAEHKRRNDDQRRQKPPADAGRFDSRRRCVMTGKALSSAENCLTKELGNSGLFVNLKAEY